MNIHFGNQSQFELFPKTTGDTIENVAPRFIFSRVILSFENLVVVFVFIIVSLIIAFSVGVERGRHNLMMARSMTLSAIPATNLSAPVVNSTVATAASATLPMSRTLTPPVRTVSVVPGTAEAARVLPQTVPVLPVVAKTGPSEKVVDKGYTVQVASYKNKSDAQGEADALRKGGLDSLVMAKGKYSIVCVGRFGSQDEAKGMANKLKKRYKDCVIRSL